MEILFLGKTGWFCKKCKDSLVQDGLLIQQVTATANYDPSNQGVNMQEMTNRSKRAWASQVTSQQTPTQPTL
jgi:hypothetical protein